MSDVEENNFEGRVSTKPREPSLAAARCSGFLWDERGRAGLRGVLRGPAGSSLWSHRGRFFTSQDGFWVTLLPQTPRITSPSPFLWRLIAGPLGPISPSGAPCLLPTPRLPYLCSEVWVPVGREETAGSSPRLDSGRCFLRWRFWRPRAS